MNKNLIRKLNMGSKKRKALNKVIKLSLVILAIFGIMIFINTKTGFFKNLNLKKSPVPINSVNSTSQATPSNELIGTPILPFMNEDASKMFDIVNDYKESINLPRALLDNELCKVASKIIGPGYYEPKEPTMSQFSTDCPMCSEMAIAYSINNTNLLSIINLWKQDEASNEVLEANLKYGCVRVEDKNLVLVLGNKNGNTNLPFASSKTKIQCYSTEPHCKGLYVTVIGKQCTDITCCQMGENKWELFPTREKCLEMRSAAGIDNSGV